MSYRVLVENIGTVYEGPDFENAEKQFAKYVALSKQGYGSAAHKPVTLMRSYDDEPIDAYYPPHFFERQLSFRLHPGTISQYGVSDQPVFKRRNMKSEVREYLAKIGKKANKLLQKPKPKRRERTG
jgi:hypothetical protein